MSLNRSAIGWVALVGIASGCSDAPDPASRAYPVSNERGLITDARERAQPLDRPLSEIVPFPPPVDEAEMRAVQDAEEAAREQEKAELTRQERERERARRELAALEEAVHRRELEDMIWERQQARRAPSVPTDRRRANSRVSRPGDQSDAVQSRATSLYLIREAARLREEARSLRGGGEIDNGPSPITIP